MLAVYLLLPVLVGATIAVATALRGMNAEATRLRDELDALGGLRPALIEVRSEAERARRAFQDLGNR